MDGTKNQTWVLELLATSNFGHTTNPAIFRKGSYAWLSCQQTCHSTHGLLPLTALFTVMSTNRTKANGCKQPAHETAVLEQVQGAR